MLPVISKISILSILVLTLATCNTYELPNSPYPAVETGGVTNTSSTQVTFSGNLIHLGDRPIINHGFVWGFTENVVIGLSDQGTLNLGGVSTLGKFQGDTGSVFNKGSTYYVKAFVATDSYKVYGAAVAFRQE